MNAPIAERRTCTVCGGSKIVSVLRRPIAEFVGARLRHYDLGSMGLTGAEIMGYAACRSCSFTFATPTLSETLEDAAYNEAKAGQIVEKEEWLRDPDAGSLYQTHHKWVDLNPFVLGLGFHFRRYQRPRNPGPRLKLLDVGCGYGHTLELARVFGIDGVGCDIDQSRLAACRAKGLVAVHPDAVTGQFDIVISSNVIEHVFDLRGYMSMIASRLAPEGIFVFSGLEKSVISIELRKNRFKLLHPIEHRNILTRGSLVKLLGDNGLRLVTAKEVGQTMKATRSKAPLYLPFLVRRGFVPVNGVFSAIARHI